jgi:hypothetical protein
MPALTADELLKIRDKHEPWLRQQPGVVGTSVGLNAAGEICLKVFSDRMTPETRNSILERLSGIPTSIEETGWLGVHKM